MVAPPVNRIRHKMSTISYKAKPKEDPGESEGSGVFKVHCGLSSTHPAKRLTEAWPECFQVPAAPACSREGCF